MLLTRDHTTFREDLAGSPARRREPEAFGQTTEGPLIAAPTGGETLGAVGERRRAGVRRG